MSTDIPTQERVIDPFASYNSNIVNKLTEAITHDSDGLLTISSMAVTQNLTTPNFILDVSAGYAIQDDVLIKITQTHSVDTRINNNWVTPIDITFSGGTCYLVLHYKYAKQRPAPEAKIKLLQPTERHLVFGDSDYLLLKVITISSSPHIITALDDNDTEIGYTNNQREYIKYYAGGAVNLPSHNPIRDTGRIAYESKRNRFFFGHNTEWKELTAGGVSIDVDTDTTGVNVGTICYVNDLGVAELASATSFNTAADMCIVEGGRGIISGFAEGVSVETGISITMGDVLFLSDTEPGTVTNIKPSTLWQIIGRSLSIGNDSNPIDIIFSPKVMLATSVSGQLSTWAGVAPNYFQDIDVSALDSTYVFDCHWFDATTNLEYTPENVEIVENGDYIRVHVNDNTLTLNYMIQSPTSTSGLSGGGGGGTGGTIMHNLLLNLDYASSSHTGFSPNPHGSAHHSVTYLTAADIATIDADTFDGQLPAYYRNATNLNAGTISSNRGVLSGSGTASFLIYSGTSRVPGTFYGGTLTPSDSTRLNYDGTFFATQITGNIVTGTFVGSGNAITTINANNVTSGTIGGDRGVTCGSLTESFLRYNGTNRSGGRLYGGTTNPVNTLRLNYDGNLHVANLVAVTSVTSGGDSILNGIEIGQGGRLGTGHETNTSIGYDAMINNHLFAGVPPTNEPEPGRNNTAVGYKAMNLNGTGTGGDMSSSIMAAGNITAIGYLALAETPYIGTGVVAIGSLAGYGGTIGWSAGHSVYIGYKAGYTTRGNSNIYIGPNTGMNGQGSSNVCVGTSCMKNFISASENTLIGASAGGAITTGNNNVLIGHVAGTASAPSGNITIQSNIICIGDNDITNAYIKVPWTVTSDARDKTNISSILHGLEFVNSIEPIKYKNRVNRESNESSGPYRYGFKAQDILKLEGETPVIVDNTDPEYLKLKETSLIPILVNAIKELSAEVDKLKIKLLEKT